MALDVFEPARYSTPELHFLLEHLGESPVIALRVPIPPGANRRPLEFVLRSVYEHVEIEKAETDYEWAGVEALAESIQRYLLWLDKSAEIKRRGITDVNGRLIAHPSMYEWDEMGSAFPRAVGADASDMVRTEILDDGTRRAFAVTLANRGGDKFHISDVITWVKRDAKVSAKDDKIAEERNDKHPKIANLRCTICDFTQQFDPRVAQSKRIAMARMTKHLKDAKEMVNRHRILLAKMQH